MILVEVGIFLVCVAATIWMMVTMAFKVRAKMHDGICGCKHNVSFHLAPGKKSSMCHYKGSYNQCQCQRFVPLTNVQSAMIEAGTRELA